MEESKCKETTTHIQEMETKENRNITEEEKWQNTSNVAILNGLKDNSLQNGLKNPIKFCL